MEALRSAEEAVDALQVELARDHGFRPTMARADRAKYLVWEAGTIPRGHAPWSAVSCSTKAG